MSLSFGSGMDEGLPGSEREPIVDVERTKLLTKITLLEAAVEDALEIIHDEFCGSSGHHPFCMRMRTALALANS